MIANYRLLCQLTFQNLQSGLSGSLCVSLSVFCVV